MPKFSYSAKDKKGKVVKNIEDASSKEEIFNRLRSKGFFVTSLRVVKTDEDQKNEPDTFKKRGGKHKSIKIYDLAYFARNLATILSAGVTLLRSLEVISSQCESIKLSDTLRKIITDVKSGLSLSEAVKKYPDTFSLLWAGLVEAGEASGNLTYVLNEIASFLEMRIDFERKIKSAMIYPGIVVFVAVLAMFASFKFIIPRFMELFGEFNVILPAFTAMIFNITLIFNEYFAVMLLLTALLIAGVIYFFKSKVLAYSRERMMLKTPVVDSLYMNFFLERFSSSMFILLESGVPLINTLEITGRTSGAVIGKYIDVIKNNVRDGASLSAELFKYELFPPLIVEMARIGEETGNMGEMFKKISVHYRTDLETRITRLTAAFEPVLIVFLAVFIGVLVISLYMPIFQISSLGGAGAF